MIDVAGELLTIDEAAPLLRVAPAVVQDYIRRGRRGIYLEATVIGGRLYMTRDAVNDFCRRWAESRIRRPTSISSDPSPNPARLKPSKASLRAERDLEKMGF